jgi:hypothetical protein
LPALGLIVLAACTGGHGTPLPSSLLSATTTSQTTYPDLSNVSLPAIAGVTTVTVGLTPGGASINGQVVDDTGAPVPSATVHLERIVGNQVASADVTSGGDGTFNAPGIIGGLYRVRAWRPPDLAIVDPQIFFLGSSDAHSLTLQMQRFTGQQVSSSIAPDPPIIGEPANLVVLVSASTVDPDGTVRGQGQPGVQVSLAGQGSWVVSGSAAATTGPAGTAGWQVTCQQLGAQPLSVVIASGPTTPLDLPPCAPVPTTTTSTSTTSTSVPFGATTTTLHRQRAGPIQ